MSHPPDQPAQEPLRLNYANPAHHRSGFTGILPFAAATALTSLVIVLIEMVVPQSPIPIRHIHDLGLCVIAGAIGLFTLFGTTLVSVSRDLWQRYSQPRCTLKDDSAHVVAGMIFATLTVGTFVVCEVVPAMHAFEHQSLPIMLLAAAAAGRCLITPIPRAM